MTNWRTEQFNRYTKSQLDALTTTNSKKKKLDQLENGLQYAHKCFQNVLSRIGRPDVLWSVNKLARSITKWTKACDKRLNRLISYIHHTCEYKQYCHVGNTAQQCRLGLFQDSDFAGDLEVSKSTSGRLLCTFGSHTFVSISWMCKNKLQFRIAQQSQKSFPWTQDWAWMGFQLLVFGFWLLKCSISP